jgi:Fic family protein
MYQRISGFPAAVLEVDELRGLGRVWQEKKAALASTGAYKDFITKLQREWAIETGIIERLYTWDRGVTEMLIEQGIESSIISHSGSVAKSEVENVRSMVNDHLAIVDGLFSFIKGDDPLTEAFIRNLQQKFTTHQDSVEALTPAGERVSVPLIKGDYKKHPNNPRREDGTVHLYCPPEFTKEEMESLVSIYRSEGDRQPPEVTAAWLHHRFTQIHPFQDGNGRVARALATLVFLRAGLFPLVIRDIDRSIYITALEKADDGNLAPLVTFFASRQRDAVMKGLVIEQQVHQDHYPDAIMASAMQLLTNKFNQQKQQIDDLYRRADALRTISNARFEEIRNQLTPQLQIVNPNPAVRYEARTSMASNSDDHRYWFQRQIVETAKKFDYYAKMEPYRSWSRLSISTDQQFEFVVSFHGLGPTESGLLAVSAFTYSKVPAEGDEIDTLNPQPAATDLFQFNYLDTKESMEKRFRAWLESALAIALEQWKRSL